MLYTKIPCAKLQCDGTLSRFFSLVAFLEDCLRRSSENFSVHYASLSILSNFDMGGVLFWNIWYKFVWMTKNISRFHWCQLRRQWVFENALTFKSILNRFKQRNGKEEIKSVDFYIKWVKVKFCKIGVKIIHWLRKGRGI